MTLTRTEQIQIKGTEELSTLCHLSKNLYNQANYVIKQEFITTGKWIRGFDLIEECKLFENYKLLPAQSAQQTIRLVDKNWASYFTSIKEWKKHPDKFKAMPKMPHYKPKDGEAILIFTNQQAHIRNHLLTFTKKLPLKIKTRLSGKINQVRFIPKGSSYICEIVYEKQSEKEIIAKRWYSKPNKNIIGIDYGVANIVTMHKLSKFIVDYCVKNDIETISIGHNNGWKQEVNLRTKTNQKFVTIPYNTLTQMIKYKAQEQGIIVKTPKEDHTSKCSFLDLELIEHREVYLGKRISRGLFRSSNGTIIHSDVNGAYNIIRRSEPKAFADGVGGCGLHPISLNPLRSNN